MKRDGRLSPNLGEYRFRDALFDLDVEWESLGTLLDEPRHEPLDRLRGKDDVIRVSFGCSNRQEATERKPIEYLIEGVEPFFVLVRVKRGDTVCDLDERRGRFALFVLYVVQETV
ncbi:hypothetical protein HFX_6203 (plasmid) [Haloferax mediterranei ATCC 33500]|uniref:Uncharacterized protein n=1 Tax=Haloferax mediterranei (strain ATCC 33500 / DSM 1411 / JCM 8866 / NBRC 14739 / NCIMB 2177 / R-4) TaxID=523841 RepID=I3RAR6_HALMT|nr:hypothetical protein HFX_6203 [Haloferax mediterranei ATCC 33500]